MATQVEELPENKVKLTVDVPAHDVHHAVEHAANDLAATVRIPGFRKGKVPMPLLLQRIGKERLYAEAVESHIGGWFWNAAAQARVNPVAMPDYDYDLPSTDKEDWRFSATVEVQPKPEPVDWTELEVPKHEVEVPEEAVQAELEMLQRTVAELVDVEGRPAQEGDVVVVDMVAEDGSSQRDYVVELGSDRLVEEIENGLRGLGAGEEREIAYELGDGSRRKATVAVKEIKERVLPPLDDDLAKAATEFDTFDEVRKDAEDRLRAQIEDEVEGQFRAAAIDALVLKTGFVAVGPLVEARTRELLTGLARSLQARGIDANSYMQLTGQTPEVLEQRLRAEASLSVSRELVLEAVADKLGIEVTDDEIREELKTAGESDEDIEEFIAQGGADRVRDDIRLKRALDRIASEVKPIAPELAEARESIWTPEQEQPAETPKLWTPGT
ncbi:MAG TPA: trigger factor [Gaiellaceae bacterium]|jgi:trigger factor|nr:trigger factor [Gaiellaceae bacterium]